VTFGANGVRTRTAAAARSCFVRESGFGAAVLCLASSRLGAAFEQIECGCWRESVTLSGEAVDLLLASSGS
jgi:hypothetical protein